MFENDELQIVPEEDISKLFESLKSLFPLSIHAYYYLDSLLKWKKKLPSKNIEILAPNGDYKQGIFFYIYQYNNFTCSVYIWDKNSSETFKNALISTKRLKWKDPDQSVYFSCLTPDCWCVIQSILPKIFVGRKYNENPVKVFWLSAEEALKFDIKVPEGVELGPLGKEHAETVNNAWPYRTNGTKELIEMLTWVNFGKGLFRKEDKKLIAWAFYCLFGALGILHTVEDERKKGYGKLIAKSVCKEMGKLGLDVSLSVVKGNVAGEAVFKSLGFRYAFDGLWVTIPHQCVE